MKVKLKPVYESIAAGEVKVGDVVKDSFYWDEPYEVKKITDGEHGWFKLNGDDSKDFTPEDEVLRKLPDRRHPEVLMRALEMACAIATNTAAFDPNVKALANGIVDRVLKEFESEGAK